MLKRISTLLTLVAAAVTLAAPAAAQVPPFLQCPPVGVDTSCETLIVANPGGTFTVLTDPLQTPYDGPGGDDTLVGFQNNSGVTISALSLSSPTIDIFGFDVDGLCTAFPAPAGCPFGPTGYEGPGTSFATATPFAGSVTFSPGIPPGGSAFFSLEEDVRTLDVGVCGDGVLQAGEVCDDGAANGTAASCCTTTCATTQCDDGDACTNDLCDSSGGAFLCSTSPVVCPDDFNPCTDAQCDSAFGCFTVANNAPCNDFNPCTDNDQCSFGSCQGTFNTNPCNDGNGCTTNDFCSFGSCFGNTLVNCNDNNPCTSELCNSLVGCVFTDLDGIKCDDHNPCTTDDVCNVGHCGGDPRNCFDDDPCTVDSCNSAGGAFLCTHDPCAGGACPPECLPPSCGNGHLDPGETCDPPDPTFDPNRPGQAKCRPDCTYCGDGQVQTNHGETCDDGNLLSGCTPGRPNIPLDSCQNACTGPICHDPSAIKIVNGRTVFTMHGRITPVGAGSSIDLLANPIVVQLTDDDGIVVFRSSLEAGALHRRGATYTYVNSDAFDAGGFGSLKVNARGNGYIVTLRAYGAIAAAADHMTTHIFVGSDEWTLAGRWVRTNTGWRLDVRSTFPRL